MMPQVNLDTSTIERMKAFAEPLVDNYDTVINRALDALEAAKVAPTVSDSTRHYTPSSPPNLGFTTVKSITWMGKKLAPNDTYWNPFMLIVLRETIKHMTKEKARALISCRYVAGKKEDNGFKYLDELGLSIQGQDANNAWKTTYDVLQALKLPAEVVFAWQDNPKAFAPGQMGKFVVDFT